LTISFAAGTIGAVVLDIEGTTTPIAFVYEVLFPYARRHLREHLQQRQNANETREAIAWLRSEWTDDQNGARHPPSWDEGSDSELESVAAYAEWLMDQDRKSPGLKLLQGHIWERGYKAGALRSEMFEDVVPAIHAWRGAGLMVTSYSSGSVLAQRLLFGHSAAGDLTRFFTAFFDTTVGPKTSPASYRKIAAVLGRPGSSVLFLSDAVRELDAAAGADYQVALCVRPGNPPQPPNSFATVRSFADIVIGSVPRPAC
jgi:enolase-phosphatase E1